MHTYRLTEWQKNRILTIFVPFESFHSSFDEKTPVAKIISLQTTPLYGLCGYPVIDICQKYVLMQTKKMLVYFNPNPRLF